MNVERDPLTRQIILAAIRVHSQLGPGLLESSYETCLSHELSRRGVAHRCQVPVAVRFDGVDLKCGYRMDLLVAEQVVVELKAVEKILPIHKAQLLTYMRHSRKRTGLLLNFYVRLMRDGIVRMVL